MSNPKIKTLTEPEILKEFGDVIVKFESFSDATFTYATTLPIVDKVERRVEIRLRVYPHTISDLDLTPFLKISDEISDVESVTILSRGNLPSELYFKETACFRR